MTFLKAHFSRANATTYSQVTALLTCTPGGSTTQLTHVLNIPLPWHWEWPQCDQIPFFPDSCQILWLSQLLLLPWVPLGEHRIRPKTTLQPSIDLFKESKSSGSPLGCPCQKTTQGLPQCPSLHSWLLPAAWQQHLVQLCCICQDCVTLSHGRWGFYYTISVQTQGLLRMFIGYTCIAHAFKTSGLKLLWPLIRSNRYIHSVGKFSVCALSCSWQEFGRGMRLSKFPAQLGQWAQMLPWSSCHVPPGQHTSCHRSSLWMVSFFHFLVTWIKFQSSWIEKSVHLFPATSTHHLGWPPQSPFTCIFRRAVFPLILCEKPHGKPGVRSVLGR